MQIEKMNLKQRIQNFENWISSGCKDDFPNLYQNELGKLFRENKEAYTFYRNWLYKYLLSEYETRECNELHSFFDRNEDLDIHSQIVNHFSNNSSSEIFSIKRINSYETSKLNPNSQLNQAACFQYQQEYENEVLLEVLASFCHLNASKSFDVTHRRFRDRKNKLRKGVVVDYIKNKIKSNSIVSKLFNRAYSPKLRNTIGHNNYKIEHDQIESIDGSITINREELIDSLIAIQSINNYLLNYMSSKSINQNSITNSGVLGIAFGFMDDLPVLQVFQLSSFFCLGNHNWLKEINFSIKKDKLNTEIGSESTIIGEHSKELNSTWFSKLRTDNLLTVILSSIIPRSTQNEFIELDVGQFVVENEMIPFDLEYKITKHES